MVTKGGTQKLSKTFKITDITIHWKALEEQCLMVPLVFLIQLNSIFWGKHFLNFPQKPESLKCQSMCDVIIHV
jgi:hypothetical protein